MEDEWDPSDDEYEDEYEDEDDEEYEDEYDNDEKEWDAEDGDNEDYSIDNLEEPIVEEQQIQDEMAEARNRYEVMVRSKAVLN